MSHLPQPYSPVEKKKKFKMLIFLFLRLLCCQSKAAVAIIHMYMYNNLLILKLPWLSRHARAACANQIKAAPRLRPELIYMYVKKKTVCLKIFMFPRILAVLAISWNMHYGLSLQHIPLMLKNAFKSDRQTDRQTERERQRQRDREREKLLLFNFSVGQLE